MSRVFSVPWKGSTVEEIGISVARPFIERWHYSGQVPTGRNLFFGWWVGMFDLYAVACYGIGVNPYQSTFLSRRTGENVTNDNLLVLRRLCRSDPRRDGFPLTAFLSRCHKMLSAMGYEFIVSFSDPNHGHDGGIYRAANFNHLGKTNAEWYLLDQTGEIVHRRRLYHYAQRHDVTVQEARRRLGLERVKTLPKDRWFIRI